MRRAVESIQRPAGNPYKDDQRPENFDANVVIDVVKDVVKEFDVELSERQLNIVGILSIYPTISVAELTKKMSGKNSFTTRTIQRDIAYLQNHDIIKREGGRKEGKWIVLKKQ